MGAWPVQMGGVPSGPLHASQAALRSPWPYPERFAVFHDGAWGGVPGAAGLVVFTELMCVWHPSLLQVLLFSLLLSSLLLSSLLRLPSLCPASMCLCAHVRANAPPPYPTPNSSPHTRTQPRCIAGENTYIPPRVPAVGYLYDLVILTALDACGHPPPRDLTANGFRVMWRCVLPPLRAAVAPYQPDLAAKAEVGPLGVLVLGPGEEVEWH